MLIVVTLIKVSLSREKGQSEVLNYFVLIPLQSAVLRLHISVHKKKSKLQCTQEQKPGWALAGGIKCFLFFGFFFRVIAMPVDGVLK